MSGELATWRAAWFRRKVAELGRLLERLTPDRRALALRDHPGAGDELEDDQEARDDAAR